MNGPPTPLPPGAANGEQPILASTPFASPPPGPTTASQAASSSLFLGQHQRNIIDHQLSVQHKRILELERHNASLQTALNWHSTNAYNLAPPGCRAVPISLRPIVEPFPWPVRSHQATMEDVEYCRRLRGWVERLEGHLRLEEGAMLEQIKEAARPAEGETSQRPVTAAPTGAGGEQAGKHDRQDERAATTPVRNKRPKTTEKARKSA
ncbi:hypothetical protein BDZ90DRAFT_281122 [Jaminaea rosea]|uniref:Uncharacterized protein n=1 Tax=Jaminaea rosea TaxID=1569628 RepID=A0A316ULA8_9BASI|nr:hypothetical protein BDZ90DRAFT_281122 [Jaminaea rosea]PWN25724.1 hypothetical protein BDZ90DRAFT_281122 [Jaminaea rosea]